MGRTNISRASRGWELGSAFLCPTSSYHALDKAHGTAALSRLAITLMNEAGYCCQLSKTYFRLLHSRVRHLESIGLGNRYTNIGLDQEKDAP